MYEILLDVHKIKTTESRFLNYVSLHNPFFENFKNYAEYLSEKNGKIKKKSNKASSYKIALIRRAIAYEKIFNERLTDFNNMETYSKLKSMDKFDDFKNFNREKKNFYSAALTAYLSYLTFLKEKTDNEYKLNEQDILIKEENFEYAIEKKRKTITSFSRDLVIVNKAKIRDKYICQYNTSHKTFTTPLKTQYIEVHHLIPLSVQELFQKNLDVLENVVCLCPNCHAQVHFADYSERKNMIDYLFDKKKLDFQKMDINIERKELYGIYRIISG